MDPFALTRRLKDAPIDSVVNLLRDIHQKNHGSTDGRSASRASDRRPLSVRANEPESKSTSLAVAALRALHERQMAAPRGSETDASTPLTFSAPGASVESAPQETGYDRVRDHFHQHEASLRKQAWLTDQILDRMQTDGAPPASTAVAQQQELRLRCPVGGATGGAFVLANEFDQSTRVSFRRSALRGAPVGYERSGELRFQPDSPVLEPGAEHVVQLSFDLADCPLEVGDELGLVVDVLGNDQLILKLWVHIVLHAQRTDVEVAR